MKPGPYLSVVTILAIVAVVTGCGGSNSEIAMANKELVRQFAEASNARDFARIEALLAPDFTRHCQATPDVHVNSPADFLEFLRNDAETFPDSRVTITHLLAEDSLVALWASYSGTQEGPMGPFPPSHKRMDIDFSGVFRVEGGKLAELWVTWDNLAGLAQLGHFPPPMPDSL